MEQNLLYYSYVRDFWLAYPQNGGQNLLYRRRVESCKSTCGLVEVGECRHAFQTAQ